MRVVSFSYRQVFRNVELSEIERLGIHPNSHVVM